MTKFQNWDNSKIAAQCIFPRLDCDKYGDDEHYADFIKQLVKHGVGGFCIFHGNTEKVKNITFELQMFAEIPLLFCADFENGVTMRLEDGTDFPHAMALGKTNGFTGRIAKAIARESKDLGIFWNLAPVCDINSNPQNPVINIRSFGENPETVTKHIQEYTEIMQMENVAACAKHFPGHGDTSVDSHIDFPIINKNLDKLFDYELIPFKKAIESNVKTVMLGHLIVKQIDEEFPISLSKNAVDILRNQLDYNGIILTDALDMQSIMKKYSLIEIVELAFKAGNDILLMPDSPSDAIDILTKIIDSDNQYKNKAIKSVDKIYNLKRWTKLIPFYAQSNTKPASFVDNQKIALRAALQAVKIEGEKLLPIPENTNFSGFSIIQKTEDMRAASRFFTMLASATENDCELGYIDENISENEIKLMKDGITEAQFIIFALFYRGRGYTDSMGNVEKINQIINDLADGRDYIVVFFGVPYIANRIHSGTKIIAYSDSFPSLAAAIMKLTGRILPDNY